MYLSWLMRHINEHKPNEIRMSREMAEQLDRAIAPWDYKDGDPKGLRKLEICGVPVIPYPGVKGDRKVRFIYKAEMPEVYSEGKDR
jgi:hypothetical protein